MCKCTLGRGYLGGRNSGDFGAIDVMHATLYVATLLRRIEFAKAFHLPGDPTAPPVFWAGNHELDPRESVAQLRVLALQLGDGDRTNEAKALVSHHTGRGDPSFN